MLTISSINIFSSGDSLRVTSRVFNNEYFEARLNRPHFQIADEQYVTYAELFAVADIRMPEAFFFDELSTDFLLPLSVWIDPGTAPDEKIDELLESFQNSIGYVEEVV